MNVKKANKSNTTNANTPSNTTSNNNTYDNRPHPSGSNHTINTTTNINTSTPTNHIKTKSNHEQFFKTYASCISLITLIAPILFLNVYSITLETNPKYVFEFCGGLFAICMISTYFLKL
ncbi:unnamed protein product [Ambrosiozyma monospora]|uniref:Unnamed protein product n=1 Tax=Ambrosiozyma monospora TaxID=43982 RepID=A0ACB5TDD4_AMBMO|nr:unnamed protein product [Ambrosiozyma monospora]